MVAIGVPDLGWCFLGSSAPADAVIEIYGCTDGDDDCQEYFPGVWGKFVEDLVYQFVGAGSLVRETFSSRIEADRPVVVSVLYLVLWTLVVTPI